jgi:predicted transglutaminase-like cysteine proteinase
MRYVHGFFGLVFISLLSLACAAPAVAASRATKIAVSPLATSIRAGETTSTPWGWLDFCNRYPDECRGGSTSPINVTLTRATWQLIRDVNASVNDRVKPMSDMDHWNAADQWDLPTDGYGDCEDYVLLKRKLLIAAGLPRQALLVTVVKDEQGAGHAVLTVKSDHGEFILDNMRTKVRPWNELPYRFVKRQSQTDPNIWVQIGDPTSAPLTVAR